MAVASGGIPVLSSQGYLEGKHWCVLKKRMIPGDMYVVPGCGSVRSTPSVKLYQHKPHKCTNCAPLFMKKIEGMVIGFNVRYSEQVTSVKAVAQNGRPVIEPSRLCVVLDIEGTTTPISFVTDILFPYARDNVQKHLVSTYDSVETQDDIKLLRAQIKSDLEDGIPGSVPVPPDDAGKHEVIESVVANVEAMIKADRKITALKQLQGHIWRTGFESKELQGVVFDDVPEALEKWHVNGIKVYIYSSGSREAQRLIFGNTAHGDLRKYLCGFFDTTVGNKREARSYFEISQSVGVDKPSQILFVTDVYDEAVAARAAGVEVVISIRPGNGPLPENHGFPTIRSFAEI